MGKILNVISVACILEIGLFWEIGFWEWDGKIYFNLWVICEDSWLVQSEKILIKHL